jgi:hypothetical protein
MKNNRSAPICFCGFDAELNDTMAQAPNKNAMFFYKCAYGSCKFFEWIDDSETARKERKQEEGANPSSHFSYVRRAKSEDHTFALCVCSVCSNPMVDPVLNADWDHRFCRRCFLQLVEKNIGSCPASGCHAEISSNRTR